jgi:hypothetical protein
VRAESSIVTHIGIQKVRRGSRNQHPEAAQVPRIGIEKSECLKRGIRDVSGCLEDRETSPVSKHLARTARCQRRGQHVVVGAGFDGGLLGLRDSVLP